MGASSGGGEIGSGGAVPLCGPEARRGPRRRLVRGFEGRRPSVDPGAEGLAAQLTDGLVPGYEALKRRRRAEPGLAAFDARRQERSHRREAPAHGREGRAPGRSHRSAPARVGGRPAVPRSATGVPAPTRSGPSSPRPSSAPGRSPRRRSCSAGTRPTIRPLGAEGGALSPWPEVRIIVRRDGVDAVLGAGPQRASRGGPGAVCGGSAAGPRGHPPGPRPPMRLDPASSASHPGRRALSPRGRTPRPRATARSVIRQQAGPGEWQSRSPATFPQGLTFRARLPHLVGESRPDLSRGAARLRSPSRLACVPGLRWPLLRPMHPCK